MKFMKMAVAAALAFAFGDAYAFHAGGVANCEGCHTMHNSSVNGARGQTGSAPRMTQNSLAVGTTNQYLLQGEDPSSTCLNCHAGAGGYRMLDPNALATAGQINRTTLNFTPGGDFAWLQIGARKGHNIKAAYYSTQVNYAAETRRAPPGAPDGNSWTGEDFSCVSCHDPHGQARFTSETDQTRINAGAGGNVTSGTYPPIAKSGSYGGASFQGYDANGTAGAYRLLGGDGWKPRTSPSQPAFAVDPPVALAPSSYNASESAFATNAAGHTGQTVVAYVSGMSEWCGTCHPKMHGQAASGTLGNTVLKHPSGASATLGSLAANYNSYIKTGDLNGSKAYDALVPVELNGTRAAAAALPVGYAAGVGPNITVGTGSSVMCLSCHRAHASGFDFMMRFEISDFNDVGTSGAAANKLAAYYERGAAQTTSGQYGSYQRMMCNKCHVKD